MQNSQPALWARDHTLFGVCEALGEDFGFNPLYLRVALAVLLLPAPAAVLGFYAGAGLLVLVSRRLFPNPRPAAATTEAPAEAAEVAETEMALAA
ncbi:MAG TPA: PspC domain-containing protein [Allosphingosinicella sp.]|nr:PspC domain-containing protein [Allosphingosinicella sp.]